MIESDRSSSNQLYFPSVIEYLITYYMPILLLWSNLLFDSLENDPLIRTNAVQWIHYIRISTWIYSILALYSMQKIFKNISISYCILARSNGPLSGLGSSTNYYSYSCTCTCKVHFSCFNCGIHTIREINV